MNKVVRIAVFSILTAAILIAISAQAQTKFSTLLPKSGVVTLKNDSKIGDLTFQKGMYHVYCDHSNERHMMVFTRLDPKTKQRTRDITMVPCDMKSVSTPITTTAIRVELSADGLDEMKEVTIRGDSNVHVLLDH